MQLRHMAAWTVLCMKKYCRIYQWMFMEKPCIQILYVESGRGEREERRREGEKLVSTTHKCGFVPCGFWASDIQAPNKKP